MTTRNPEVPYFGAIGEVDLDSHLHLKFRNLGAKIWDIIEVFGGRCSHSS